MHLFCSLIFAVYPVSSLFYIFSGLSDRASEGEYYWPDCSMASNFTLSNWDVQQPSDTTGSENCVLLQDNGKINDRDCSQSFAYVCEIIPDSKYKRLTFPSISFHM